MRKLMWFTIGFTIACGVCAYGLQRTWMLPLTALSIIAAAVSALLGQKWKSVRPAAVVFIGLILGLGWFSVYHDFYLSPSKIMDGRETQIVFTVSDYSNETEYGTGVDGILSIEDKQYQIRAYLNEKISLAPGDSVSGVFRIRLTTPDANEASTYHQGKGIFLLVYQREEIAVQKAEEVPARYFPAVLRRQIKALLAEVFPEDVYPFTKALLLGDGSDLSYEMDTAFKLSGIRHIIAVSGLHISILYGLIALVTFRRRFLTAVVGVPVLFLFAAVAGFTPSVTRACIMVWLMLLARVFDREYDSPTALAFAVLVMLVVNPLVITSVSLQLSAGCVAGILLFQPAIQAWLKAKLPKRKGIAAKLQSVFCTSISVTLGAMSLVTPLSAWYFGTVSLIGVVTNLLTLWVVNLIFNGLVAVCLLYIVLPGFAAVIAGILAWPIRFVLVTAKWLGALPLAAVYTDSVYVVIWLVFVYVLLSVFLLCKNRQPGILMCCGALVLCLALLASWTEPFMAETQITMLDVGQGQSILLQSEGRTWLVDCGGDDEAETADIIAERLLSRGIHKLDGIILTHYDRDHAGALENLLTRVDAELLFLPDTRNNMVLPDFDGEIIWVWEDLDIFCGNSKLTIFGPIYSGMDNENSLCVLFDTEKCDILITGDRSAFGERMLMRKTKLPDVDILVAGHHGAADSTSEVLLHTVTPETVLISAGLDNRYGHPSAVLLQRLADFGCTVYRTDHNGTITIRR